MGVAASSLVMNEMLTALSDIKPPDIIYQPDGDTVILSSWLGDAASNTLSGSSSLFLNVAFFWDEAGVKASLRMVKSSLVFLLGWGETLVTRHCSWWCKECHAGCGCKCDTVCSGRC